MLPSISEQSHNNSTQNWPLLCSTLFYTEGSSSWGESSGDLGAHKTQKPKKVPCHCLVSIQGVSNSWRLGKLSGAPPVLVREHWLLWVVIHAGLSFLNLPELQILLCTSPALWLWKQPRYNHWFHKLDLNRIISFPCSCPVLLEWIGKDSLGNMMFQHHTAYLNYLH